MCCWFLSQFAAYSDSVWNLLKFCIIHTVIYKVGENKNATKFQPGDAWTFHRNINLIKTHSTGEITIFLTFGKRIIISLKEIWLEEDVKWENITKKDHTLPEALILLHECSETLTAKSILIFTIDCWMLKLILELLFGMPERFTTSGYSTMLCILNWWTFQKWWLTLQC